MGIASISEAQEQLNTISRDLAEQTEKIQRRLDELNCDLSAMNPKPTQGIDFQELKKRADARSLENHLLYGLSETLLLSYFSLLCMIAQSAEKNEDAWFLLQRIASGSAFDKLERAAVAALQMADEKMENMIREISKASLACSFLLDAMLVYLCCGEKKNKSLAVLMTLTELLHPKLGQVKALTMAAKAIALRNTDAYLEQAVELSQMDWPGRRYLKKLVYTNDITKAEEHGFKYVILRDCTSKKELYGTIFDHCCLVNCKLTGLRNVRLAHCFVLGGRLRIAGSNGLPGFRHRPFTEKDVFSNCRFLNGASVFLNDEEVTIEKLQ